MNISLAKPLIGVASFDAQTDFSIAARLIETAQVHRDKVAVVDADGAAHTYGEVLDGAARIAARLQREGVVAGDRIGVMFHRSSALVEAILAILSLECAYVPVDPKHPTNRIGYVLDDAQVKVVVRARGVAAAPGDFVQFEVESLAATDAALNAPRADAERSLYVIYTSGSTGRPKGVDVSEGNLAALFGATQPTFEFGASDVWTLFHSPAFDFSVWEIFGPLLYGAKIVCVDHDTATDPHALAALLLREKVTVLSQTPSAFYRLLGVLSRQGASDWAGNALRWVVFGGEALSFARLAPWLETPAGRARLANMYGITETCVHVSLHVLSDEDIRSERQSVIGKPLPGLSILLLDPDGRRVPEGEAGEAWICGPQIAKGYLGRPELTAQRFAPPPTLGTLGPIYRSGDILIERLGGDFVYVGRCDNQINIRGFRVELEEVETAIQSLPAVADACVAADGAPDDLTLIAFVAGVGLHADSGIALKHALRAGDYLPEYMIPHHIRIVAEIPLTINGKKDRKLLLDAQRERAAPHKVRLNAPQEDVRARVRACWIEALGQDDFADDTNFFDAGGDSIRAFQLHGLLIDNGLFTEDDYSVVDLFEFATVSALAAQLTNKDVTHAR
jgi:amino acid adenylation domain-containing protein